MTAMFNSHGKVDVMILVLSYLSVNNNVINNIWVIAWPTGWMLFSAQPIFYSKIKLSLYIII